MTYNALNAIVGVSAAIVGLRELIRTIAPTKLPVLIQGPTGAGKELVAAAIHEESGRRGAFVPFNVCAIGDSMFEDALFGHTRGAFTGATAEAAGFLREANGGTAFFDEISGLPLLLQAKLLRAIETGAFRPVGARRDERSDFRLVAAANEPISALVARGRFRVDLAHRLSGVVVRVPALAQRTEDIPLLLQHFLRDAGGPLTVPTSALDVLVAHTWPGNVRELRHVVECATALGGLTRERAKALVAPERMTEDADVAQRRTQLRATLETHCWNADSAAKALGVHRTTIYRWMRETRLVAPRYASGTQVL